MCSVAASAAPRAADADDAADDQQASIARRDMREGIVSLHAARLAIKLFVVETFVNNSRHIVLKVIRNDSF